MTVGITGIAVRQIEGKEVGLLLDATDDNRRLAEVGLRMARRMGQRHEHLAPPPFTLSDVILHDADRVKTRAVAGMEVWVTMICRDPT